MWPQVLDLGGVSCVRQPPVEPDAFYLGHAYGDKIFTNGSDREKVAKKFRETCEDVFSSVTEFDFHDLKWRDQEMKELGAVLPLCEKLMKLNLSHNRMTSLPKCIGRLPTLKELILLGCYSLSFLPDRIGQFQALEKLVLDGCSSLTSFPESIG